MSIASFRDPLGLASSSCRTAARVLTTLALGLVAVLPAADEAPPAQPPTLTSINDFYNLTPDPTSLPLRFCWDVNILYSDPDWTLLWVENNGLTTFLPTAQDFPSFAAGQRVRLEGELPPGRGLLLDRAKVTVLPGSSPVRPLAATGRLADCSRLNNRLVTLEAVVDRQSEPDPAHLMLEASAEGLHVVVRIHLAPGNRRPQFEGSIVQATGVYVGQPDFSGRLTSIALWVPDLDAIRLRCSLQDDPAFATPAIGIDQIGTRATGAPAHVVGIVHAFDNNAATVTLRDATGQVVVSTAQCRDIRLGRELEAVGTPELAGLQRHLRNARVRPVAADRAPHPGAVATALRLVDQVLALTPDDAALGHPVQLFGVATWMAPDRTTLFIQDVTGGIEIRLPPDSPYSPVLPCSVRIDGRTDRGTFAPLVVAAKVAWNNPLGSPDPKLATLDEMLTGNLHGRWVETQAYLRALHPGPSALQLDLTTATGEFAAWLPPDAALDATPGSLVALRGVCCVVANERRQRTGLRLLVPSADDLTVEQPAPPDPFALPARTIAGLREFGPAEPALRRVRTLGTVLYHEPGRFLCLQEGNDALLALSRDSTPLHPGDRVEVVGLPGSEGSRMVLREAIYRRTGQGAEPAPADLLQPEIAEAALDGRLVRLRGTVTGIQHQPVDTGITVQAGKRRVEAALASSQFDALRCPERGLVSLQGVYRVVYDEYRQPIDFTLRLRAQDDIALLEKPPLWTVSRALTVAGALLLLTAAVVAWLAVLRARVAQQTRQIRAQLEHQSQLEAELQKAQRIESLGLLAAGIAHDFNNLLTGILGNIGLCRMDTATTTAESDDYLSEAEHAALRARDLTQRLLVFTKGAPSSPAVVRLPELVRESATFALHGSSTRCEFAFAPDLWLAEVDRVQTGQVVQNLVINAMQAMPAGGILHLALANEELAAGARADLAPGRYIRFTVTDTGAGIPAELLPKIFDPYFTTKKTGNGLGLATVYSIVRRHRGHIEVESTPGRGTTFRLWIPAANTDRPADETGPGLAQPTPALVPPAARRVLIMDDDPTLRRLASIALLRSGYEVTSTSGGSEAVEEFTLARERGRPYHLVILDLTVPGEMGGKDAMAAIRRLDPQVRSIVATGYVNNPVFAAYPDHGFDAALAKPYEVKQLLALVTATLAEPVASNA